MGLLVCGARWLPWCCPRTSQVALCALGTSVSDLIWWCFCQSLGRWNHFPVFSMRKQSHLPRLPHSEPHVCFFQIRLRGPLAVRASDAGSAEELTIGTASGSWCHMMKRWLADARGSRAGHRLVLAPEGRPCPGVAMRSASPLMLPWVPRPLLPWRACAQMSIVFPGGRRWL